MTNRLSAVVLIVLAVTAMSLLGGSAGVSAAPSLPSPVVATSADDCDKSGFFGLEPWYHFLPNSEIGVNKISGSDASPDECGIKCFNIFVQNKPNECGETASDIPGVILAIIDDLLRVAAIVSVIFIIIGSFQFSGSRGNSERTAAAQSTVIAALTGLAISIVAVGMVSFIGNQLKG
jgi:hypothetical protein